MRTSYNALLALVAGVVALGVTLGTVPLIGQTPAQSFTAKTDNVGGAHESIRIDLVRWSSDTEREQLLAAWNLTGAGRGAGRGAAGRGGAGRGGRGAATADPAPDPAAADDSTDPFGTFRGGRNGNGNSAAAPSDVPKVTPESSLTTALGKTTTLGYLWSSEVAGYAIRSAVRLPSADGGERIILITDRRLGAANDLWKPVGPGGPTNYGFSLIELRLNPKGEGEGKVSLAGKVAVDSAAKTLALENYGALPVVFGNVKRRTH